MSDDEVDVSDVPPLDAQFFERAIYRSPAGKVPVLLSIDEEIAAWFQAQEGDFRNNLNNALRQFAESHR